MKKENVFKIILFFVLISLLTAAYFGPCENRITKCWGGNSIFITRTFVHLASPSVLCLLILLFLSYSIFTKWIKFAVSWVFLSLFFISLTPEYSGGWISLTPDREQVSIWMSSLFLIISLILITIWQIKERRGQKK